MNQNESKVEMALRIALFLVLAIAFCWPLLSFRYYPLVTEQDTNFHLCRLMSLGNVFRSPVNFSIFQMNGIMLNPFYPWQTFYPAYMLTRLFHNVAKGFWVYYILLNWLTLEISYWSVREITQNKIKGMAFAILYTFSCYRAINGLFRFAIGEFIAMSFLPLVFWGMYEIFKGNPKRWFLLSLGMTCVMFSHVVTTFLLVCVLAILGIVFLLFGKERTKRLKVLCLAAFCSLGMNLGQITVMAYRMKQNQLNFPFKFEMVGETPNILLKAMLKNDMSGYTVGLVVFLGMMYCLLHFTQLTSVNKLLVTLAGISLYMCTNKFSWKLLEYTPLYFIQFPFRLNLFSTLFFIYVSVDHAFLKNNKRDKIYSKSAISGKWWVMICIIACLFLHTYSFSHLLQQEGYRFSKIDYRKIERVTRNTFTQDYSPKAYADQVARNFYEQRQATIDGKRFYPKEQMEPSHYQADFINPFQHTARVNLPIYYYAGGIARLDGQVVKLKASSRNGGIQVDSPPGHHRLTLTYPYKWYEKLSYFVSFLSLACVLFIAQYELRKSFSTKGRG